MAVQANIALEGMVLFVEVVLVRSAQGLTTFTCGCNACKTHAVSAGERA